MNRAGKIALGCLLAPIGILVLIVVFFAALKMTPLPEPNVTQTTLEQGLGSSSGRGAGTDPQTTLESTPVPDPVALGDEPVVAYIDLEEGYFTVVGMGVESRQLYVS